MNRARWRVVARNAVIAAGFGLAAGCPSYIEQQRQREKEIKAADVALDRDRIVVQTGDLALPHDALGELAYVEPFSASAIDEAHVSDRLRTMAIAKWGNQVDAVIEVKTTLSTEARQVNVTAFGVRVKGDCSFCRHQGGYAQGQ